MPHTLLNPKDVEFLILLGVSLICGLLIGAEREHRGKPTGMRTHTLVITAAMLFTFLSRSWAAGDPTRIAAQIVSGVGFLGAGIILKGEGQRVSNVTTAASIWYSASVGMAIGYNYYVIAIAASLYAVVVSQLPRIPALKKMLKRQVKLAFAYVRDHPRSKS